MEHYNCCQNYFKSYNNTGHKFSFTFLYCLYIIFNELFYYIIYNDSGSQPVVLVKLVGGMLRKSPFIEKNGMDYLQKVLFGFSMLIII